jgi:hypothetical protein
MGLSLRTKERLLEVWLKDGRNEKVRTSVSNKLRQVLNLDPDQVTLYYKEHQKSIKVLTESHFTLGPVHHEERRGVQVHEGTYTWPHRRSLASHLRLQAA